MRSSFGQIKDFVESVIWTDMVDEAHIWLEQIRTELEDPDGDMPDKVLHRLGGSALAIRNFLNMPQVLMGLAEDKQFAAREARLNLKKGGTK